MAIAAPGPTGRHPAQRVRACAWCAASIDEGARRGSGRVRCPRCGVATADPWPTDAELERAYAGPYRPATGRFSGPGDALLRRLRGRLATRLDRIAPPGPVLDVGAGDGALLDALRRRGREATGLERDPSRPGLRAGELADQGGGWAAIVLWHSLEHLRAPAAVLADAAERLAPGGVLVVAIPNADSLQAALFGDSWFALDPPRHLTHIPASALLRRPHEVGLELERVSHLRGGRVLLGSLHGLVGRLPGRPDLYDAVRRAEARRSPTSPPRRAATLLAALALAPLAAAGAAAEVALRRGGTVYVEARHR